MFYTYGDIKEDGIGYTELKQIVRYVYFSSAVFMFSINPAIAVDAVANIADMSNKTRSVASIAFLATVDTLACNKAKICYDQFIDKAKKNPKTAGVVVCTAAAVWCARGITERVVNRHF